MCIASFPFNTKKKKKTISEKRENNYWKKTSFMRSRNGRIFRKYSMRTS